MNLSFFFPKKLIKKKAHFCFEKSSYFSHLNGNNEPKKSSKVFSDATPAPSILRMSTPQRHQRKCELPVVIDTGASTSITSVLSDFVGPLQTASVSEISGISSTTRIAGKGIVEWHIIDYWNIVRTIRTEAYYAPDTNIRLFSPQVYFQEHNNNGKCTVYGQTIALDLPDGSHLEFPINKGNILPYMLLEEKPLMAGVCYNVAYNLSTDSSLCWTAVGS